ncbi:hypothetical protein C4577_00100 [Candidatus Parcubacteria bacterium]|nr:MAG: hypothetical protein C4577_00100 [Candidatus Parcubacteria bacterium]
MTSILEAIRDGFQSGVHRAFEDAEQPGHWEVVNPVRGMMYFIVKKGKKQAGVIGPFAPVHRKVVKDALRDIPGISILAIKIY